MGRQKLGWVESDKSPNPKSPYKVHIFNIRMEKKTLKTNVEWPLCGE